MYAFTITNKLRTIIAAIANDKHTKYLIVDFVSFLLAIIFPISLPKIVVFTYLYQP